MCNATVLQKKSYLHEVYNVDFLLKLYQGDDSAHLDNALRANKWAAECIRIPLFTHITTAVGGVSFECRSWWWHPRWYFVLYSGENQQLSVVAVQQNRLCYPKRNVGCRFSARYQPTQHNRARLDYQWQSGTLGRSLGLCQFFGKSGYFLKIKGVSLYRPSHAMGCFLLLRLYKVILKAILTTKRVNELLVAVIIPPVYSCTYFGRYLLGLTTSACWCFENGFCHLHWSHIRSLFTRL